MAAPKASVACWINARAELGADRTPNRISAQDAILLQEEEG